LPNVHRPNVRAKTPFGDAARPPRAALVALAIGLVYLWWRSSTIGSGTLLALSIPLLAIEAWSLAELGLLTVQTWRLPPPTPRAAIGRDVEPVDIAIVVAGAEVDELERTLLACRSVRSRGRLIVIDDDRRFRPRSLAADAGASYRIDRRAVENPGLAAFRNTTSPHYLWLRAGELPMPDLLEAIGPLLDRDDLAVCQLATSLLNSDDLAHLGRERDDDGLVNQVIGPALSRWDAGLWLGSASVIRREAIEDIGGFDRRVPVERLVARLHRAGWASAFERRRLVATTAPEAIDHYVAMRRQRAGAALSVLLSADGPLMPGGAMGLRRRLAHIGAVVRFGTGLRLLAFSALIVAVLLTGRFPVDAGVVPFVAFATTTALAGAVGRGAVARESMGRGDWINQGWRVIGAETAAVIDAVTGRVRAVPPERSGDRATGGLRSLAHLPLLDAIVLLLDLALLARAATIVNRSALPAFTTGQRIAVIGVALITLVPIVRVLQLTVVRQQRRSHYRIPVVLDAAVDGAPASTTDITQEGAGVLLPYEPTRGATTTLEVSLPGADGVLRRIAGRAIVRSARPEGPGTWRVGLELVQLAPAARQALLSFCAQQPVPDDAIVEEPVAVASPVLSGEDRRRQSIRRVTTVAGLAGLATVVFGPGVASASTADPGLVEQVCVVDTEGLPVIDVAVERLDAAGTQVLGATDLIGCLDTGLGVDVTGFAVSHRGTRYELQPRDYRGSVAQVALVPWSVLVVDLEGEPVPSAEVRVFTDRWLPAADPVEPDAGHRFDGLPIDPADQQIEVRLDGVRHVRAMGDQTSTRVVLSRARVIPRSPDEAVPVVDRGRGWEPLPDGSILVPGPVVIRLADGEILRLDVPESHELILPDGVLVAVELQPEPGAEAEPGIESEPEPGIESEPTEVPSSTTAPEATTSTQDPTSSQDPAPTPTSTSTPEGESTSTPEQDPSTSTGSPASEPIDDGATSTSIAPPAGDTSTSSTGPVTSTTAPTTTAADPSSSTTSGSDP